MNKYDPYVVAKTYLTLGRPVLLEGPAGTGKTTMAMNLAKDLGREFYSMSLTKQTTVNKIEGFISIDGTYIGTQFRKAVEEGGLFLLDELDAGDPNTLLCLNTLENGYMTFPDARIHPHPDFCLIATANPQHEHNVYTGRSKLDFSTRNRFVSVEVPPSEELEIRLTSPETHAIMQRAKKLLKETGSSKALTYRDAFTFHQAMQNGLEDFAPTVLFTESEMYLWDRLSEQIVEEVSVAAEWDGCETSEQLWEYANKPNTATTEGI